jgi:hypothetical protein
MMNFHEFHYKMSEMLMKMSEMFNGLDPYFLVRVSFSPLFHVQDQ